MNEEQAYEILGSTPPQTYISLYGRIFSLYQLCSEPNRRGCFHIRKYVVNSSSKLVSTREFAISESKLRRLKKALEANELLCYPVASLKGVPELDTEEILSYRM